MQKIGAHVSAAGGVSNAPIHAFEEGCETFQFFVASPQTYVTRPCSEKEVQLFKQHCKKYKFTKTFVHAAYLINLASPHNRIRYGSINLLRKGLEECARLGVTAMMFHLGSANGCASKKTALITATESLNKVLEKYTGKTKLLIENAAGAGATLGVTFEEIGTVIKKVKQQTHIGMCLDTQHAFASGYDWRTTEGTNKALRELSKQVGMKRVLVIHANDSKVDCGTNRDRHEHIGKGFIGKQGLYNLLHHPKLKNIPFILETPNDLKRHIDIVTLKHLRDDT
ncbi:MAG TPA: deoxyribonuclease IV [Patescibacteria group bacterium]|nr:deoxyribonuclease IV [Patescibacteria group bacterium]